MLGKHLIKSRSSTQASVSLSSGEAEFYGCVKAAGIGLGYRSLLQDLGMEMPVRVWTDSTASIGICSRRGLGKLRHIATQHLWIQHRVRDGTFELRKLLGTENPADVFTKHLTSAGHVEHLMRLFGCEYRGGRAESAPQLRHTAGTRAEESLLTADPSSRVLHDGRWWNAVESEYGLVPEAKPCPVNTLPHETGDQLEDLFPRAIACAAEEESEEECDELERYGIDMGMTGSGTEKDLLRRENSDTDSVKKSKAVSISPIGIVPTARMLRRSQR